MFVKCTCVEILVYLQYHYGLNAEICPRLFIIRNKMVAISPILLKILIPKILPALLPYYMTKQKAENVHLCAGVVGSCIIIFILLYFGWNLKQSIDIEDIGHF